MCPQLKGHRLFPWDSTNGSCHSALLSLSPPNYGVLVRAVQKAVSHQAGTLLLREQNLALTAHSARAQQSFPRHAQPWPVTQGPRSGEDGINIVSIDCLNSDFMFSFSVFLGLFLSPSCQTSSCGRLSWKEIQPELELWRKWFVFCSWGSPARTLTDLCKRNAPGPALQPPHAKRSYLLLDVSTVNSEFNVLRKKLQQ